MTSRHVEWRLMTAADIPEVDIIGEVVHPDFPEDIAVMENRQSIFPQGCFAAQGPDGLLGYAISHPSIIGEPAPLDTIINLPENADCLFLHDIALSEAARGLGLGSRIVPLLTKTAKDAGFDQLGLVSVNNSLGFWQSQGFKVLTPNDKLKAKLKTYSEDAAYMVLAIA